MLVSQSCLASHNAAPDVASPTAYSGTPADLAWYCLRAKPKKEQQAAGAVSERGIETYCPLIRFQRVTRRGRIWFQEALFPGYFFARFDYATAYRAAVYAPGVATIVSFGNYTPRVPDDQIDAVRAQFADDAPHVVEFAPAVGETVRVVSGPFQGLLGVVTRLSSSAERVRLLLEFLGRTTEADVSIAALAAMTDARHQALA